ncbi:MAG TPA: CHASE domain-containing protein [Planctomycetota bacterium]|nr:CHASE domain-containing protein [Planctomycetota bacterium]
MIPLPPSSWTRRAAEWLGTAAAYFIAGKLALLLAIPPGYATAVWPSAGIALASALLFGARVWPGVLLGSFLVNVGTSYDPSSLWTHVKSLGLALSIGAGAALQAVAGTALTRHFISWPNAFAREREVLLFVFGVAPLSSLVNASAAVTSLFAGGLIPERSYLFSWWTWWVGDTIGVVLFTPILLLCASKEARRRILLVAPPLGVTFALVVVLFVSASAAEKRRIRLEFEGKVGSFARAVERNLENHLNVLHSIVYYHQASSGFDQAGFKAFVAPWLRRYPSIQGYSWNPRVSAGERGPFEERRRREGFGDFRIRELDADGRLVPAAAREEYIPVLYIEPYEDNKEAVGFDVFSDPVRREALVLARDEGRPAMTRGIALVQDKASHAGVLLFVPVFRPGTPGTRPEERRQNLEGFVTGVLRVHRMLEATRADLDRDHLRLRIEDASAPEGQRLLFDSRSGPASAEFVKNVELSLAGRPWRLQFPLTEEYLAAHRSWAAWSVLAAGMLFTGFLGALLLVLTGRAEAVRGLVVERTAELEAFSYTIAHDLRSPLRAIHRFSDLLREDFAGKTLDGDGLDYLKRVADAAARMDRLIEDLLDFSRVARIEITLTPVALAEVLDGLQRSFADEVKEKNGRLSVGGEVPSVLGDRVLLTQALNNLVSNALKFVPAGATPDVEVLSERRDGVVRVTVRDRGIGIAPEHQGRLFRIFERLDTAYPGTGVGLAIVKKAVERMHGRLGFESAPGRGSAFWLELPEASA